MKAGGLYIAVGLLAVLGGTIYWTNKHPQKDTKKDAPAPTILKLDPTQMEEIRILSKGAEPVALRKKNDVWDITEPKPMTADSEVVSPLTGALAMITADRLIDEHPASLTGFGLDNPSAEVDVTMKGGKVVKVLLGSDTPSGSNIYIKTGDDPKVYTVASSVKTDLAKSLNDVRDKRFMTFTSDKLAGIDLKAKGPEVVFARNADNEWQMTKPRLMRADPLLIDDMTRRLKDARMDMANGYDEKTANKAFAEATHIATVVTTEGTTSQTFEVRKTKDKEPVYYAKSSLDPNAYKIVNDIGDGLDKSAEDFRAKKVFNFGFQDGSKLTINDKTYEKSGDKSKEKWTLNGVEFDSITIQDVFDKLRDLAAVELSEKKGGTPALTISDTYGEKKRTEKVTFYKDGTTWRLIRDDDPSTVYVVDGKLIDDLQKTIGAIKQYQPPPPAKK